MPNLDPFSSDAPAQVPGETSLSLLHRVQALDAQAWNRFVQLYGPTVYRWCRRGGLDSSDAADVAQAVFLSVAQSIGRFRREKPGDSLRGWLRTITRNKMRDFFRTRKRQANTVVVQSAQGQLEQAPSPVHASLDAESEDDAEQSMEIRWLYRRAVELIQAEFSESTRRAFWEVVVANRSPALVAEELGITINAVYVAKSRVLARLRDEFADLLE